jgi:transposase
MTTAPGPFRLFVGVDIAARSFTASWISSGSAPTRALTFAQTPDGFAAFQERLRSLDLPASQTLIVLEATSSYWVALAVCLHQAGFVVALVNPAQVHNYARSLPRRAKTDALDAQLLAQFAAERQPECWTPPPQVYHELRQRLVARDSLLSMRQQARNQLHALEHWPVVIASVQTQFEQLINELQTRLDALDAEISAVLNDGAWAASAKLVSSIIGIGMVSSAWLLVATLNFEGCATAAAAAAYAGLVPLAHSSGTSVRGRARIGPGGHARLRTALYMATISAARYNPLIRAQYERLRAAGKPTKVARCAAARKLLQLAYAVVSKGQPFEPAYQRRRTGGQVAAEAAE